MPAAANKTRRFANLSADWRNTNLDNAKIRRVAMAISALYFAPPAHREISRLI